MERKVLITGASIAGPALAWWLTRAGATVTIVERAPEFRDAGQNVDVRGAGRTVVQRMDLEDRIRKLTTGEEGIAFVDENNRVKAEFPADVFGSSNGLTAELEILRGDLARLLYGHTRQDAKYIFGDRIHALDDQGDGVEVTFERGGSRRFDLVIAAEGIGSSTRKLVFGEAGQRVPLDLYMGYFTIPRGENDEAVARWFNAPGGRSIFLRPDNKGTTRVVLTLQQKPEGFERQTAEQQKAMLKERFADAGWEASRILAGLTRPATSTSSR